MLSVQTLSTKYVAFKTINCSCYYSVTLPSFPYSRAKDEHFMQSYGLRGNKIWPLKLWVQITEDPNGPD